MRANANPKARSRVLPNANCNYNCDTNRNGNHHTYFYPDGYADHYNNPNGDRNTCYANANISAHYGVESGEILL